MPWTDEHIETERLRLRPARPSDTDELRELLSSAEVRRYLGGPLDADTIDAALAGPVGERPGSFVVAHLDTDRVIGGVRLGDEHDEPEVSYDLLPSAWGRGYATEAVTALLAWLTSPAAAAIVGAPDPPASVIAVTQRANERSVALLRRLGFEFEREFVEFDALQSQYRRAL